MQSHGWKQYWIEKLFVFVGFFLIKSTHPPILTAHHFVHYHYSCLYRSIKDSTLCPVPLGEIEITRRWNPLLQQLPPQIAAVIWPPPRSPCGLREQENALSLLLQRGWCWWPHASAVPRCDFFSSSSNSPSSIAQALSSEHPLTAMHHTRREVHLRDFGHLWVMAQ